MFIHYCRMYRAAEWKPMWSLYECDEKVTVANKQKTMSLFGFGIIISFLQWIKSDSLYYNYIVKWKKPPKSADSLLMTHQYKNSIKKVHLQRFFCSCTVYRYYIIRSMCLLPPLMESPQSYQSPYCLCVCVHSDSNNSITIQQPSADSFIPSVHAVRCT